MSTDSGNPLNSKKYVSSLLRSVHIPDVKLITDVFFWLLILEQFSDVSHLLRWIGCRWLAADTARQQPD